MLAFATADDGSEDEVTAFIFMLFKKGNGEVDNFFFSELFDLVTTLRAVRRTKAGKEDAEIIIDLSDGSDRRAGVTTMTFLVDRNAGRETFDLVDIGFIYFRQELARVGRERLNVAALAFSKDGVEGKGGFAGAGKARKDDKFVSRDFQRNVFEIVFAGAFDSNLVFHRK